jgi:hypothetical protein
VRRLGVNVGAPGSRKAENGTLWVEYPPAGGPSPKLAITSTPARPETFRLHASQVEGNGLRWVGASGARGLTQLRLDLGPDRGKARRYTVRLYFLEPDELPAGARLFDVAVQGRLALERLDVRGQAGGARRLLMREVRDVAVERDLTITLAACADADVQEPVLSGVEVVLAEGK